LFTILLIKLSFGWKQRKRSAGVRKIFGLVKRRQTSQIINLNQLFNRQIYIYILHHRGGKGREKQRECLCHGRMNYKDTKPYMSAFLSVDLFTEFAAFRLTDFIDWRYIHSWFVFSTQLVNCCPHGRRNYKVLVYCCPSTVPSL
jgi:hypothetical protein